MIPTDALCTCGHTLRAHTSDLDPLPCDALIPNGPRTHWTACPCTTFAWDNGKVAQ